MADVKWVKITTDMFDNRKVKFLRKLPEGNSIVLIWVMLLTMAGRCNSGGMIFLTENIPYTPKMLADELDFEESTVVLALQALAQMDMVVLDEGILRIAGWEEYQNVEGLDRIREQNRLRKQHQREREKLLLTAASEKPEPAPKPKEPKHKHGRYQNVLLTDGELEKLKAEFPNDLDERIERLSEYMESTGKKYKSHIATIRAWARKDEPKEVPSGRFAQYAK